MIYKIKKFFSFLLRKKISLRFLVLILFGILFPSIHPALAVWDWLVGAITLIPATTVAFIALVLATIASLLAALSGIVLNWVISPGFTTLSYTNPANNEIIRVGLGITQGFVNMILVLILVYIAIATILRLAGHETKKLLVAFIVVALLVNFAPVICGIVVDASNIIMNFFLSEITGGRQLINSFGAIWEGIKEGFDWKSALTFTGQIDTLFLFAMITVLNLTLSLVLLLFSSIFMFRYIVIWILVILSPLAFACYILPATKKYFDLWWKQLINWSFIGVTCGFFLYLAELLATQGTSVYGSAQGLGSSFLPHLVPLGFLAMGLIFGLQTSAMGASSIMNLTKKSGKWVGGKVAQRGIGPVLEKMRAKEAVGKISRGIEKVPVARWFLPEAVRKYGEMRPAIEKGQQRAKAYSSQVLGHRLLKGADTQTDAAGDLLEMIERGDEQDLYMEAKKLKKWKGKSDQEILADKEFQKILARPLQIGASGGMLNSKFLRAAPRLARVAWKKKIGSYADHKKYETEEEAVQEATRQARRPNINQMERETFEDMTVVETMMEKGREVPEAVVSQVKKGQETMQNTIDKLFSGYIDDTLSKTDAVLATAAKSGKDLPALERAWEEYRKYFKSEHKDRDGYFEYAEGQRAKEMGWRKGQYMTKDKRKEGPAPTTPFGGAGVGSTPVAKKRTKPLKPGEETEEEKKNKPKK